MDQIRMPIELQATEDTPADKLNQLQNEMTSAYDASAKFK